MLLLEREEVLELPTSGVALERNAREDKSQNDAGCLDDIEPVGVEPTFEGCHPVRLSRGWVERE